MLGRDIVIGALAPARLKRKLQRSGAESGAGQAPAKVVVATRLRQAQPDLRRAREPALEHPEAIAEPRLMRWAKVLGLWFEGVPEYEEARLSGWLGKYSMFGGGCETGWAGIGRKLV